MTTYLVSLGVNDYRHPISPLKCCQRDAREVVSVFKERFGFHAHLIESTTLDALVSMLRRIELQLAPGDTFVFYFSGHGKAHRQDHFLLLPDVDLDDLADFAGGSSGVGFVSYRHLKRFTSRVSWAGVKRLFILDACRTPIIEDKAGAAAVFDADFLLRDIVLSRRSTASEPLDLGLTVVNSCDLGASASELPLVGHGLFTAAFLDRAREAEKSSGSLVVDHNLCASLEADMSRIAQDARLPKSVWHRPVIGGEPLELRSSRSHVQADEVTEWQICLAMPSIETLQAFIRSFPQSRHKVKALEMLAAFGISSPSDTVANPVPTLQAPRKVSLYPTRSQISAYGKPAKRFSGDRPNIKMPLSMEGSGRSGGAGLNADQDDLKRDEQLWNLALGDPTAERFEQYLHEATASALMREEAIKRLHELRAKEKAHKNSSNQEALSKPLMPRNSDWEPDPTPEFRLSLDKVSDFLARKNRRQP